MRSLDFKPDRLEDRKSELVFSMLVLDFDEHRTLAKNWSRNLCDVLPKTSLVGHKGRKKPNSYHKFIYFECERSVLKFSQLLQS